MEHSKNPYRGYTILIIITYVCMIVFGLLETLKGAIISSIRTEFLVDYTHIGQMLFGSSFGYLIATFFGGMAIEKYGLKKIFIFGAAIVTISSGLFSFTSNFDIIIGIYFMIGLGFGSLDVGLNTLGAKIFIKNPATMMNLMHLFFGVGAAIAPKYAASVLEANHSWRLVYWAPMLLMLLIFIVVLFIKFPEASPDTKEEVFSFKELVSSSKVWLISLIVGLFVLMEAGVSNWLVNYLQEARFLDVVSSTNYLTWFFAMFTLGRLVGGFIVDKVGYVKSLLCFAMTATLLVFAGLILGQGFIVLFSLMGFFVSIMFPTMMVVIMKEYTYGVGAVMGFVITVSGVFNSGGNWLVGKINDLWGVSAGMASLGISGMIACVLLMILNKHLLACGISKD